jgi:hypothetical protein
MADAIIKEEYDDRDIELGIGDYRYSDLYDPLRLKALAEDFYAEVHAADEELHERLAGYIETKGEGYEQKEASKILTDAAPFLSDFVARLFNISPERDGLKKEILGQDPLWKYKFFVQRRAIRKYKQEDLAAFKQNEISDAIKELKNTSFTESYLHDAELAVASVVARLMAAEEELQKGGELSNDAVGTIRKIGAAYDKLKDSIFGKVFMSFAEGIDSSGELLQVQAVLQMYEIWSAAKFYGKAFDWYAFKTPHSLDYQHLVRIQRKDPRVPEALEGLDKELRRRDGFKLTDERGTMRDSLAEIDYCLICHERGKDSCSTGLHERDGSVKTNPLGIKTAGCPLDEKISEMHLMKKQGDPIASLALVTIDNPMCAGTGHRICNDCMKGCIFQKQEPVNIPLAETSALTDVLDLPYGFEIYSLLSRWNPLNALRPYHACSLSSERRIRRDRF